MAKPAGVQIQRWFAFLVGLLIAVNLVALTGSVGIARSIRVVVREAQPLAASTARIEAEILAAQRDLFQYLAEVSEDSSSALAHLDRVKQEVADLKKRKLPGPVAAELDAIVGSAEQYRKVLELLPRTVQGSRDWSRLEEYSSKAVELGRAVEERSSRLAEAARTEIRDRSTRAARLATVASWGAAGILLASAISLVALRHWWKKFQELILGL